MAIAYQTGSGTTYASRTNITVTAPTGITDGDILLAFIVTGAATEAPDVTAPTGFTTAIGSASDQLQSSYNVEMRTFIKVASGESGDYTFTHSSCSSQGWIGRFSGVDNTTPQDATSTLNQAATGADGQTTSTGTGLTTVTNGAMLVWLSHDWGDTANNLSVPAGMTERRDTALHYVATEDRATAGATGNRSHTNNNAVGSGHDGWAVRMVALRPAASGYTLDADAGSYAITGTAAGTQRNRLVDAAAGSYAVTGTAAGTQLGRQLAAAAGSYAVTGSDVTFPKTWILDAAAGSYSLTGTAAGLQLGHLLDASAGSYALSGTDAALTATRIVDGAAGSYAITGQAAGLAIAYPLDAAAGSYAISGQAAALTVGYQVAAAAGSYAITGADATFPRTYLLDAGAGSYTISGTDAALTIQSFGAYLLDADGGSYLISGTAAALLATHNDLIADAGSYAITGQDAGLSYAAVLEAQGGEYLFTGSPATLTYDGAVAPAQGRSGVSRLALNAKPRKPPKWMLPTEGPREMPEVPVTLAIETAERPHGFDPKIIDEDIMRVAAMLAGFAVE